MAVHPSRISTPGWHPSSRLEMQPKELDQQLLKNCRLSSSLLTATSTSARAFSMFARLRKHSIQPAHHEFTLKHLQHVSRYDICSPYHFLSLLGWKLKRLACVRCNYTGDSVVWTHAWGTKDMRTRLWHFPLSLCLLARSRGAESSHSQAFSYGYQ